MDIPCVLEFYAFMLFLIIGMYMFSHFMVFYYHIMCNIEVILCANTLHVPFYQMKVH